MESTNEKTLFEVSEIQLIVQVKSKGFIASKDFIIKRCGKYSQTILE